MVPVKRKRKLKNLTVEYVSFVDKGANKAKYYLTKGEHLIEPNFEFKVQLICSENRAEIAEQLVYGLVYAPDTVDAHGDYTDAETLRKAANEFLLNYNKMDEQHNLVEGAGHVCQSAIAPSDFVIGSTLVKAGSWYIIAKANDEVWKKVQDGTYTGFSLYGTAEVEYERTPFEKLLDFTKALIPTSIISKEDKMDEKELKELIAKSQEMLKEYPEFKASIVKSLNELAELKKMFEEFKTAQIEKAEVVTKAEIATVTDAIAKMQESITNLTKFVSGGTGEDPDESDTKDKLKKGQGNDDNPDELPFTSRMV